MISPVRSDFRNNLASGAFATFMVQFSGFPLASALPAWELPA